MTKVAVVLSGCGHADGAEIRESVIALLELDRNGAETQCFAPDTELRVVDHRTGKETGETRSVLAEAARIARGAVLPLDRAKAEDFDALVMPGGYGAAKNLSSLAADGKDADVLPALRTLIRDFLKQGKPVGAICISPAVVAAALKGDYAPEVTIGGEDKDGLIASFGGRHRPSKAEHIVVDAKLKIVSCPAYMTDAPLRDIAAGIALLAKKVVELAEEGQNASRSRFEAKR
jgi:enhancing lycopene biosynthesis protein 2